MESVIEAIPASDRSARPKTKRYIPLTLEECKSMSSAYFLGRDGKVHHCRRNGQNKEWKTRPGDLRIPMKFGLYTYFYCIWEDYTSSPLTPVMLREVDDAADDGNNDTCR